jgi:site-specific recombinase XerC
MRRFCRWLVSEGELEKAPTDGIELPNSPNKPVPILLDAEITALLKACAVPRGRPGVFDRTVFGTDAQQQRTREDRHQLERHRSHGSSS